MAIAVYDASVVIGLLRPDDPHHSAASEVLRRHGREVGRDVVLPASAYAEILVHPNRSGDHAVNVARDLCRKYMNVVSITQDVAEAAARLRARHSSLRLPDALVLATAEVLSADCVVTADAHWTRFSPHVELLRAT